MYVLYQNFGSSRMNIMVENIREKSHCSIAAAPRLALFPDLIILGHVLTPCPPDKWLIDSESANWSSYYLFSLLFFPSATISVFFTFLNNSLSILLVDVLMWFSLSSLSSPEGMTFECSDSTSALKKWWSLSLCHYRASIPCVNEIQ